MVNYLETRTGVANIACTSSIKSELVLLVGKAYSFIYKTIKFCLHAVYMRFGASSFMVRFVFIEVSVYDLYVLKLMGSKQDTYDGVCVVAVH